MSLISVVKNRLSVSSNYKELALAKLLHTDLGDAILEINKILKTIDEDDRIKVLNICKQLYYQKPISPLDNPMFNTEFIVVSNDNLTLQSTRLASLFSNDGGISWYDIDIVPRYRSFWNTINKLLNHPKWLESFIMRKLLYYVDFPYDSTGN